MRYGTFAEVRYLMLDDRCSIPHPPEPNAEDGIPVAILHRASSIQQPASADELPLARVL
jgi:hypothetical protein